MNIKTEVEEHIPDNSEHLKEQYEALLEEEHYYYTLGIGMSELDCITSGKTYARTTMSPKRIAWQQAEIDELKDNKVEIFALHWNLLEASDIANDENIQVVCDAIRDGKIGFLGVDLTDCPNNQYRLDILDALQGDDSSVVSVQLKGFIEPQLTDQLDVINATDVANVFEKIKETMSRYDSPIRWVLDDTGFTADNMSDLYRTAGDSRHAIGMLEFPDDITKDWYKNRGGSDVIDRIRFGNAAFSNLFHHIKMKGPENLFNYRKELNEQLCSGDTWRERDKAAIRSGCLGTIAIINMSETSKKSHTAISSLQRAAGKEVPSCLRKHYIIHRYEKPHQTNAERLHLT